MMAVKNLEPRPLQRNHASVVLAMHLYSELTVGLVYSLYPKEGLKNQTILKCVVYSKSLNKIKVAISARSKCYLIV